MKTKILIDFDAAPFVPESWSVAIHHKDGQMEWDPTKVRLHVDKDQDRAIKASEMNEKLRILKPYNANLLDFLLKKENQHLIPEEWKGKEVFFWGTIYRSAVSTNVRGLHWVDGGWRWCYDEWIYAWAHPLAVLAGETENL